MSISQQDLKRKAEHLRIVLEEDVTHSGSNLLECVRLLHDALCEVKFDNLDLSAEIFGRELSAPLMITSMTGGAEHSREINENLARVASDNKIAFAVGSQKIMLRYPETAEHFKVRSVIPDGVLLGNIGATLLGYYSPDDICTLVDAIEADGMCIHLNPAQEMIQVNGERGFAGILDNIARMVDRLDGNVLVKETGAGLSPKVLKKLASIGVSYIDVAGSGGTSWTKVESLRTQSETLQKTGDVLSDWGIPTAVSVLAAHKIFPKSATVIASGGIQTGLDSARAIVIGADIAGFARPILLELMSGGIEAADRFVKTHIHEFKSSMMLTGAKKISKLKKAPRVITGELLEWIKGLGPDFQG